MVSLEAVLPPQKVKLLVIDGFSPVKKKLIVEATSNMTIFELRFLIGKQVNAFIYEINLFTEEGLLDDRYNGYTLIQANIKGLLSITRRTKIEKAPMLQGGKFSPDALRIF